MTEHQPLARRRRELGRRRRALSSRQPATLQDRWRRRHARSAPPGTVPCARLPAPRRPYDGSLPVRSAFQCRPPWR
eukprot:scaffold75603_cov30-Phaeocystis_antarctica.AAC.2